MFHFFQTIFSGVTSLLASAIIAVGIVSVPSLEPVTQPLQQPQQIQNEEILTTQENKTQKIEEQKSESAPVPVKTFVPKTSEDTPNPAPIPTSTPDPIPVPTVTSTLLYVTPAPICIPNWQCGSWSTCINSQQARNCYDSNYCGMASGAPAQTQPCVATCYPNWQCDSWNTCTNGQQTRTCNDINSCGTTIAKPSLIQYCVTPIQSILPTTPTVEQQKQQCQDRYFQSFLSLEQTTQSKRTYYNNIISQTPSAEYWAERGLTSSSRRAESDKELNDAQAGLVKVETDYNSSLVSLKNILQTCLNSVI